MNTTQPIEAKPTGPSGKIWGLWQGDEIIADAMHQDEAEHFARLHNQSLRKKPETFEAHGLTWIKHTPGDPMPCKATDTVRVLLACEQQGSSDYYHGTFFAERWDWTDNVDPIAQITGWNYAEEL